MTSSAPTVDAYLASLTPDRRATLSVLRAMIHKTAPKAEETMNYGMPYYSVNNQWLVGFNAQKHYYALYCLPVIVAKHKKDLGAVDCGKCCIRFTRLENLRLDVARTILKESLAHLRTAAPARPPAKKKARQVVKTD